MTKYGEIVGQLTNHPVIDFCNDKQVHCFPEMVIGLNIHNELSVNPELMKYGKIIRDFKELLSKAYAPRLSFMLRPQTITEEQSSPLKDSGLVLQLPKPKLIVPLGNDWAFATYYGQPATKLGLTYLDYKIFPKESSLFVEYERNGPVLRDLDSINRKGWGETKRVYLDGKNISPSLKRFKKTLLSAYSSAVARNHGNSPSVNL